MEFTYKGLEAVLQRRRVTEEEVDRQLERLRQQTPREVPVVGRKAGSGDTVELDYAGFCGGEQFEGGTAEHQTLVLGSGAFIPGFEEQLMGCGEGEQVTVKVTFPQEYHAPQLAGREAEFRCTVHRIFRQVPHQLDDAFAQALGAADLEQLRQRLREELQRFSDQRGRLDLEDRLLRQAAATLEVSFSQKEREAALEEQMETLKAQLSRQGLTLEMYCRFTGKTEDQLRQEARPEAEQALRLRSAVEEIARREGRAVTEEVVASALAEICRENRITMDQLRPLYDDAFADAVAYSVLRRKAAELVRRAARIREETEETGNPD